MKDARLYQAILIVSNIIFNFMKIYAFVSKSLMVFT